MIKPTADIPEKSEIEHVTTKKTKTLSGKSTLTYHIGKDEDANLYVRIWVNSSNGYFSNEWLAMTKIVEILKRQGEESFTGYVFKDLFSGKSVNSHGFIAACLVAEGVLAFEKGKKRKLVFTGKALTLDTAKPNRTINNAAAKKVVAKTTVKSAK
jgi:hypothetical protein